MCHPEEPAFGSEGSGRAARTYARCLREREIARTARIREGGKNGAKLGHCRAIRAVCRVAGSDFHRLLDFSSWLPQALTMPPLSTTLYHILPVSLLLSSRNLKVAVPLLHVLGKLQRLVVYQSSDHKGLLFTVLVFRYSFANIFLDLHDGRGVRCGKPPRNTSDLAFSGTANQHT